MKPWAAQPYRAYLLRCWNEGEAAPGEAPAWRFSLEEVAGERRRRGFVSLEALVAFLRAELMGVQPQLIRRRIDMRSLKSRLFIPLGFSLGLMILALGVLQGAMSLVVAGLAVLAGLSAWTLAGRLRHYCPQVRVLWKEYRASGPVRRPRLQPGWRLKRPALRRSSVVSRLPSGRFERGSAECQRT